MMALPVRFRANRWRRTGLLLVMVRVRVTVRIATTVMVALAVATIGAGTASAHARVCIIQLQVTGGPTTTTVRAVLRYPDHDPVLGETVVGVAYRPDVGQTLPLELSPVSHADGEWSATIHLDPGRWQVEVDAVKKTRGLRSVGFTIAPNGAVRDVRQPSPLPATVQVPGAPAAASTSGLRESAPTGVTPAQVAFVVAMVAISVLMPLILLRRRAEGAFARP
jgi:hypothetical protein